MIKGIVIITLLLVFLFPISSTPNAAFASSENWVEVLTISGDGAFYGDSPPFKINHVEWRIKWEYTTEVNHMSIFSFYVNPHSGGNHIASISESNEKNGTLYITDFTGEFHIFVVPHSWANDWEVIVEQNTDSAIQTENWVQVATLTGQGGSSTTDTFTVENNDWRILWDVELDDETQWPMLQAYVFPYAEIKGSEPYVTSIEKLVHEQTSGVLRIYNQSGSFYIDVNASVENYRIVVQQNVDSIPEFPSWTILPFILAIGVSSILVKRKIR